jgi:hypothetical protein
MIEILWDIEIMLIKTFNWSLDAIDRTDVVSLFDFLHRVGAKSAPRQAYADEVDW